jgi:ATP-dependent protease HslVU (ClpYQ) peptidase subunit
MSVIAAMRAGDAVVIGADTAIYEGDTLKGHGDKWTVANGCALGFAGDYLAGQRTMRADLLEREPSPATLARRIRKALKAVPEWDCEWLYVRAGTIWHLDAQLAYSDCGPMATGGTGAEFAAGAMWALRDGDTYYSPEEAAGIIDSGIRAACELSAHCGGDVRLWTVHPAVRAAA